MIYRTIILITSLLLISGCSKNKHDERLSYIAEIVSESPEKALSHLDSINYKELSDDDQHFYDFLVIKAKDKGYIKHTSDSTILCVIKYYSSHKENNIYSEALYYGGRVYCDMGDSPTALQYFHKALENISDNTPNLNLKANILSQTGRLLTDIRLYDEAIPYIEKAIEIGELYKDTINMVYDLQLLGGTYLRNKKYHIAEHYFNKAFNLSCNLPVSYKAKSRMYLAEIKYELGEIDSALNLIRDTPNLVKPVARNSALAAASEIYLAKGLLDTAYIYANKLLHSTDPTNKETAYQIMLSPKLQKLLPLDTLNQYFSDYRGLLETYYDNNKIHLAINQQNFYNYQRHEIEREKVILHNTKLIKWIFGISSICLVLVITVLYYKNKSNKTLIELHVALKNIDTLNANISAIRQNSIKDETNATITNNNHQQKDTKIDDFSETSLLPTNTEKELRDKLRDKLLSLYNDNKTVGLSQIILNSEVYKKLQELVKHKQMLSYEDSFWNELENIVIESSPKFKDNLQLLTQCRLTTIDLHTALLIKCHLSPSQMSVLLRRSKGAIVSRRESLCLKIFGEQLGTKVIDGIIRFL